MCGIVGFVHSGNGESLVADTRQALKALAHRGPDDEGLYLDPAGGAGLGHRRLAVLDISARGHQPMFHDDGSVVLAYNGEVYNFRELRQTLISCGHTFHSQTDTEVVLKAFVQWGPDCLPRFNGMFTLAIWEPGPRRLFLARDRHGIKPLFYYPAPELFLFSSELKGLMAYTAFARRINPQSLARFLHFQYVPAPASIFENTFKLLSGHYLVYENGRVVTRPWWQVPRRQPAKEVADSELQATENLNRVLSDAVRDCLISDAPLGAFLSGGIDSTLVVALMQQHTGQPVQTFSIGFAETGYDEAPLARRMAAHLGTRHTEFYITPRKSWKIFQRLPEIYDEPFADASAIPTCLLSALTRQQVTVALSGDGGDEQFCGYVRYWSTRALARLQQHWPLVFTSGLAERLARISPSTLLRLYHLLLPVLPRRFQMANTAEKLAKLQQMLRAATVADLYRRTITAWSEPALAELLGFELDIGHYRTVFTRTAGQPLLSALMQVDQQTWLPDAMLTKVDRASMASSLEVRVPLLDHRVTHFAATLPENLLYHRGEGKYILKQVLARYVPPHLFQQPKKGFAIPLAHWLRGAFREPLQDYLSPVRLQTEGLFNVPQVQQQLTEFFAGYGNHQYRLWTLLMWEMWRERWLMR